MEFNRIWWPKTDAFIPPVDLHWFFEISNRTEKKNSVRTEKKFQLVSIEIFFQFLLKFFSSSNLELKKKIQ